MTIAMVAREPLEHDGVTVPVGALFAASPIQAAVLRYAGKAEFASSSVRIGVDLQGGYPPLTAPAPPAPPAPAPPARRRRRKADGAAPRRTYKRRDLTAE